MAVLSDSHFAFYDANETVVPAEATPLYTEDRLGLREMTGKGKVVQVRFHWFICVADGYTFWALYKTKQCGCLFKWAWSEEVANIA